jgi:hypothetical protein
VGNAVCFFKLMKEEPRHLTRHGHCELPSALIRMTVVLAGLKSPPGVNTPRSDHPHWGTRPVVGGLSASVAKPHQIAESLIRVARLATSVDRQFFCLILLS